MSSERIPILYLAPWVGYGGSDKNTIDWFRWIDRERFAPYLITTQPSPNPLMDEVAPFAEEIWVLPDLMPAEQMPAFIFDFLSSRKIEVIHLMNSRLGFDLLPDLSCLPSQPAVVVQLHVEEVDKSGYVRYVTTRYGNLVDRFSVSNEYIAAAVRGYGIPSEKVEVIYTGVDVEEEFSPDRAKPAEQLDKTKLQILFGARITDQKDPLLMVDVAAGLRDRGVPFQIQVVGDGDLEADTRSKIAALGLEKEIVIHPPTAGLRDWYAACDVMLMTSKFEGIPCALFEAMSMQMPIVAPALPGIRELLTEEDGLIPVGSPATPYVEALARFAEDAQGREKLGAELRERVGKRFSVQEMAKLHEDMYSELTAGREREDGEPPVLPEPLRFIDRPVLGRPLVSVLIPHYNQARFLRECIDSIRAQTYVGVEVVIVDDASTEAEALSTLEEVARWDGVEVVRLGENGGPSRARNAGLERCRGRYVLPVDSDNLLLPDAIERLVTQLAAAGEEIGFIYPNLDFFGNRDEYHEAPAYNLYTLLHANFCDTCSLIDRAVFDAGLRYHEGIHLGHEDWEFALQIATHGVRGEAANGPTVRYRKWGFNRSDSVDHVADNFARGFLADQGLFEGREAEIKANERPALSIVALTAAGRGSPELLATLAGQSCVDCELVADVDGVAVPGGPSLRRFPAGQPVETLLRGLESARGSFIALTMGTGADLLARPEFVEKVLRRFQSAGESIDAIVLADVDGNFEFSALEESPRAGEAHTVIWRRGSETFLPYGLLADVEAPIDSLLRLLSGAGAQVERRHFSAAGSSPVAGSPDSSWIALPASDDEAPPAPLLPGAGEYTVPRWGLTPTWIAPLSTVAIRYRERIGERRLVVLGKPPEHFELEHFVGVLRSTGVQGTKKLIAVDETFKVLPREEWRSLPVGAVELGYVEEAPLPGLDSVALGVHRATGQHLLISLPDDPILHSVDVIEHLGFADPFPLRPRHVIVERSRIGLKGLIQAVDPAAHRHRYDIDELPAGDIVLELGGLAESGLQGQIPVWIVDGFVITDGYRPPRRKPGLGAVARWSGEPAIGWGDLGPASARARLIASRSLQSARSRRSLDGSSPGPQGDPKGWLFEAARAGLVALYASHHPVTGDQLLTRNPEDALQLGYGDTQLLGFMAPAAPLTDSLDRRPVSISWARRAGHVPLTG
jgi:glycosyltransferase involved in cell wall biosynthesis/GT2 family glycosyltransferase